MAFVNMHIFFSDFLHFNTSLLLLTVALRGVSNKHCLLSHFSFLLPLKIAAYCIGMFSQCILPAFITPRDELLYAAILKGDKIGVWCACGI